MTTSWDFWDTLISRRVMYPKQVFTIVEILSGELGFEKLRVQAEIDARKGAAETTLDEIYSHLPYSLERRSFLKEMELYVEDQLVYPIVENSEIFGQEDIVVTDMYLPRWILLKLAEKTGIAISSDRFIISSELRKTKFNGDLFAEVLRNHSVFVHIGDNYKSDYLNPKRYGINSRHYTESALITKTESRWSSVPDLSRQLIAGALRAARLSRPQQYDKKQWQLYSQTIAPLLVAFCEHIITKATIDRVSTLYFLARDGYILFEISKLIVNSRNINIKCVYMYASRQALHVPGFTSIDDAKSWIFDGPYPLTLGQVARRVEIKLDDLLPIAISIGLEAVSDSTVLCENMSEKLALSPEFRRLISLASKDRMLYAKNYFEKIGLIDDLKRGDRIAIVDVGWRARLQRSLDQIVTKLQLNPSNIKGYYFGIKDSVYTSGDRCLGYLYDEHAAANIMERRWVDRYANLIEYFLKANHPQVLSYSSSSEGVDFGAKLSESASELIELREKAILSFASHYCSQINIQPNINICNYSNLVLTIINELFESPTFEEAAMLLSAEHSGEQFEIGKSVLFESLTFKDILTKKSEGLGYWPEGGAASSKLLWLLKLRQLILGNLKNISKHR